MRIKTRHHNSALHRQIISEAINDSITLSTEQATTSGTEKDFTGLPSWVKKVTIMFQGVSTNGTSNLLVQLGDAGGIETSGYLGSSSTLSTVVASTNYTAGFGVRSADAANIIHGDILLTLKDDSDNTWTASGNLALSNSATAIILAGVKPLSDTLTQIRITTVNGTDAFDAGSINIAYE